MAWFIELVRTHGSLVVLTASFLENIGLPIPALAVLVVAGALVVEGPVSLPLTFLAAVVGAVAADLAWFYFGKWKGRRALDLLCRLSLNPDSCVGRTERLFRTGASATILTSKLIPGLNTLVPPLAGLLRMHPIRYVLLDLTGSSLWATLGIGLGVAFGASVLPRIQRAQRTLLVLLLIMVAAYILLKILYRIYLVRHYSIPKMGPAALLEKISSGQEVLVVDLRNEQAYLSSNTTLPGSIRIPPAEFDLHANKLDKDREIILYCT